MLLEALLTATAIASISMTGALFFGDTPQLKRIQRFAVPAAVGVFLSLVLYELIPETLAASPENGGIVIALGFISFYILSFELHQYFHRQDEKDCERKGAAALLLVGDAIHNLADGVILGAAFLIDPVVGVTVGIGLGLHELPQEIVEFAVYIRAGYSRTQAIIRNFISASTVIVGTFLTIVLASHAEEYLWIITGLAAGNLLYLAATDLLPRAHGDLKNYGGFRYTAFAIIIGFTIMTFTMHWTHESFGHGHSHEHGEYADEHLYEHNEYEDEHKKELDASRVETEAARERGEEHEGELEVI